MTRRKGFKTAVFVLTLACGGIGATGRAADQNAPTAQDQSQNASDLEMTANIRKALMDSDALSFAAKNTVVVTSGGAVTLRGSAAAAERQEIERIARDAAPGARVDNQIQAVQ